MADKLPSLGFIILRHVRCPLTNFYWNHNYFCVRKHHPDAPILIIDDHSLQQFVQNLEELINAEIVASDYPAQTGELLPYLYFHKKKPFRTAVILHDSVFLHAPVSVAGIKKARSLFHFPGFLKDDPRQGELLTFLSHHQPLVDIYDKNKFNGCFGCMSIISIEFLDYVMEKYHLEKLVGQITCRMERCGLERVLGCIFSLESEDDNTSQFGSIHSDHPAHNQLSFEVYLQNLEQLQQWPLIKVWTGR